MSFTTKLSNDLLNHVFRNEEYTSPSTVYIGLFNGNNEVDGDGYERQEITFGKATGGEIENDEEVLFPIAESDWGKVDKAIVFDSKSGGNKLNEAKMEDGEDRTVRENDQFSIPKGYYTIEVD